MLLRGVVVLGKARGRVRFHHRRGRKSKKNEERASTSVRGAILLFDRGKYTYRFLRQGKTMKLGGNRGPWVQMVHLG